MSTITRFAVKYSDINYADKDGFPTRNIWEAKLSEDIPYSCNNDKIIMVSISYKEKPYEIEV
jgi:hypothetical protein